MAGTNYALIVAGVGVALLILVLAVGAVAHRGVMYRPVAAPANLGASYPVAGTYQGAGGYITVTATGAAYGTPGQEQLSVYVNGTGSTALQASQAISATLARFNSTILPLVGGNLSDIQTTSYSLTKQYNRSVYTAEEYITVTLPNTANTSSALGALSGIPDVFVTGSSATFSQGQMTALRDQALASAISNATSQAEILAGGPVAQHNITVSSYVFYSPSPVGVAVDASGGFQSSASSPIVYTGRSVVQETITAQFSYGG